MHWTIKEGIKMETDIELHKDVCGRKKIIPKLMSTFN